MPPKAKRVRLETISSSMKTQSDNENLEDKLSSLHVSLLSKILSKLPTVDAVRTCVLSKSWKNMWKNITDLQFDDRNVGDTHFLDFVDRVLRDIGNPNINSFHLRCAIHLFHPNLLISWISKVLRRNLQRLVIDWFIVNTMKLSPLFASFGSLVELRLHTNSTLEISAPILLQNLKVFSLEWASIVNKSPISTEVLLKFPVLETFILSSCFFYNTNTVILDSPLLKIFEMFSCVSIHDSNVCGVCKIKVLALKLEKIAFSKSGNHHDMFLLDVPPSLPGAHLSLSILEWSEKFLESFTCVKSLNLKINLFNDFEEIKIPEFRHLINLNLIYDMTQHSNFTMFLNSTPILEKLTLRDLGTHCLNPRSATLRKLISESAPDCVQTTLKVLQIKNFKPNKLQVSVLKFLMENAKNLESIIVYMSETIEEEDKASILSCSKASPHASVFFRW